MRMAQLERAFLIKKAYKNKYVIFSKAGKMLLNYEDINILMPRFYS